jgi:hypothetical protein
MSEPEEKREKTVKVTAVLPEALVKRLDAEADKNVRSRNGELQVQLTKALGTEEK